MADPQIPKAPLVDPQTIDLSSPHFDYKDHQTPDNKWSDFKSPFPHGFSLSTPVTEEELRRDQELQRALNARTWDQTHPTPAQPTEKGGGFGVNVAGKNVPLSGISIWDLREPTIGDVDNHDNPIGDAERWGGAPDSNNRFEPKGPRFGLNWSLRF